MTERLDPYELVADDEWEVAVEGIEVKMISSVRRHQNRARVNTAAPQVPRDSSDDQDAA